MNRRLTEWIVPRLKRNVSRGDGLVPAGARNWIPTKSNRSRSKPGRAAFIEACQVIPGIDREDLNPSTKGWEAMANLDQLKQKYAGAISQIESFADLGATLQQVDLDGEKLHVKGTVPSRVVLERVWDEIKKADPTYADLHHEIVNTGGDEQPYKIKPGDNLSHIAKRFYTDPNKYSAIAKANGISDPNKIQAGQELKLPLLT